MLPTFVIIFIHFFTTIKNWWNIRKLTLSEYQIDTISYI